MRTLNLSGLKAGDSLNISVSQGAITAGPVNVPAWGSAGGGGTIMIQTHRTHMQVAPDSVRFWVDLSASTFDTAGPDTGAGEIYDARKHDLIYLWDFDDAGAGDWTAPVNVLAGWKNRNTAKGHFVAHMYTRPGTYSPSVLVIEPSSGKTATATLIGDEAIIVADPDVVYAGANTICVNPVGDTDFAGKPPGADEVYLDFLIDTDSEWTSRRNGTPRRWLFKRGASYEQSLNLVFAPSGTYFGAYGSSPTRPVINAIHIGDIAPNNFMRALIYFDGTFGNTIDGDVPVPDLRLTGLQILGDFDATAEWANQSTGDETLGIICQGNADLMVSDCHISGMHVHSCTLEPGTGTDRAHYHMDDTTVTNFGGQYPLYYSKSTNADSSVAFTGCALAQTPGALDSDATNGSSSRSVVRIASSPNVHVRGCDFYLTDHKHAALRINGLVHQDGCNVNVHSCSFEGGSGAITHSAGVSVVNGSIGRCTVHNTVIDGCVWVGAFSGQYCYTSGATGTTIRNCLFIMPNTPWEGGLYGNPFLEVFVFLDLGGAHVYDPVIVGAAPIKLYNNTAVCERTFAENNNKQPVLVNNGTGYSGVGFTNIQSDNGNNVVHLPVGSPVVTDYAPLATDVLWTPRNPGRRDPSTLSLDAALITPSDAVKSFRPLPGSAALGTALSGNVSYMDILMQARPEPPSKGAWEAA